MDQNAHLIPLNPFWMASNPFAFLKRVKNQIPLIPGWTQLLSSELGLRAAWALCCQYKPCYWKSTDGLRKCPEPSWCLSPKPAGCPIQWTSSNLTLKVVQRKLPMEEKRMWLPLYQDWTQTIRCSAACQRSSWFEAQLPLQGHCPVFRAFLGVETSGQGSQERRSMWFGPQERNPGWDDGPVFSLLLGSCSLILCFTPACL